MANFSEMVNCSCIKEVNSVFAYPDHFSKTYRYSDQLYEERKPEICLKASSICGHSLSRDKDLLVNWGANKAVSMAA